LVGWELVKGTTFRCKIIFVPQTPFLVKVLVNFGMKNFTAQKMKGCEFVDENEHRKAQQQFLQISGSISVGQKINMFGVICDHVLEDTKQAKGENTANPDR